MSCVEKIAFNYTCTYKYMYFTLIFAHCQLNKEFCDSRFQLTLLLLTTDLYSWGRELELMVMWLPWGLVCMKCNVAGQDGSEFPPQAVHLQTTDM